MTVNHGSWFVRETLRPPPRQSCEQFTQGIRFFLVWAGWPPLPVTGWGRGPEVQTTQGAPPWASLPLLWLGGWELPFRGNGAAGSKPFPLRSKISYRKKNVPSAAGTIFTWARAGRGGPAGMRLLIKLLSLRSSSTRLDNAPFARSFGFLELAGLERGERGKTLLLAWPRETPLP